jgi:hypothetical protein
MSMLLEGDAVETDMIIGYTILLNATFLLDKTPIVA